MRWGRLQDMQNGWMGEQETISIDPIKDEKIRSTVCVRCGGGHRDRRRFHFNAASCGERICKMVLRDFQEQAVTSVMQNLRGGGSTLLVMATGLGKTVVFAEVIRRYMMQGTGRRTLVLAHRNELIHQAAESIRRIVDCEVQI